MTDSPALVCRSVTVDYGPHRALDRLTIEVAAGETLAVLGPSGSGKTTLIHAIAGFVPLSDGEIVLNGRPVARRGMAVAPDLRSIGLVFQNYALWPHLDAVDTVAYPIRRRGVPKAQARSDAEELLRRLGMDALVRRRPAEMSGGEQQRVGLARALARQADLYLFDEPTAHLDAAGRVAVQEEIAAARLGSGAAALYSSHDAGEALALADRVALLRAGRLVQVGTPDEVYARPVDVWAARLTGPASLVDAHLEHAPGRVVTVAGTPIEARLEGEHDLEGPIQLLVRPDWVSLGGPLAGVVGDVRYRGPHTDYRVDTAGGALFVRAAGTPTAAVGDAPGVQIERAWMLRADTSEAPPWTTG